MTVHELIDVLKTMPQDALVVADGYEYDYDAIGYPSIITLEQKPKHESWEGDYKMVNINNNSELLLFPSFIEAVYIPR